MSEELDYQYHKKNLKKLVSEIESYTPEEYVRYLNALIGVAKVSSNEPDERIEEALKEIDSHIGICDMTIEQSRTSICDRSLSNSMKYYLGRKSAFEYIKLILQGEQL